MRVGIVLDDFFPASGGIGRSVQTQLEELTALGHDVTLIAPDRHLEKPRIGRIIECPTVYVEGLPAHLSILHHTERRASLISRRVDFDVVHSQTERGAVVLAARIARLQGIPHVHSFHANVAGTHQTVRSAIFGTLSYQVLINPVLTRASRRPSPRARLPRRENEDGGLAARMDWASFADIAGKVDAYTVPSAFMHHLIEEAAGRPMPGHIVPTGVNRGMLEALESVRRERSDATVRYLAMGRLAKEKRLDVLVSAFRRAAVPNSELVVVGDGDQRRRLRELASGASNIDFRGHLRDLRSIAWELVNADVFTLASHRFDSQALVLSEAVAAGLPILYCDDRLTVATRPDNSLLTDPDEKSLAAGIRALADPHRRAGMRAASLRLIPELGPERTAEAYERLYRDVVASKGAPRSA